MQRPFAILAGLLAALLPLLQGQAETRSTKSLNAIADDYAAALSERSVRPKLSPRANARWLRSLARFENRLAHLKSPRLDEQARLTRRMLAQELRLERRYLTAGILQQDLGGSDSPLQAVVNDLQLTSLRTVNDWRWTLKTLAGAPRLLADYQRLLEQGLAEGKLRPAEAVRSALRFLDDATSRGRKRNPFLALSGALEKNLAGSSELPRLRRELGRVIEAEVLPAHRRLREFLAERYLPRAPKLGTSREAYLYQMERHLGPGHPSPEALGRWGRLEVKRLQRELERAVAKLELGASTEAVVRRLNRSPGQGFATGEALLAATRDELAAARATARKMAPVPSSTLAVTAVPRHEEATVMAQYLASGEGEGELQVNTGKLRNALRRYTLATLVTHEVYAGHHLAAMRAQRAKRLPGYRRDAALTGYDEGWALYAEAWRDAHRGFTPEERAGFLVMHLQRAARLVVDTGLHTGAMTREAAVEYFRNAAFVTRAAASAEIERYINRPGQALAYYYGKQRILTTRDACRKILGSRFDERAFHTKLLGLGSVPLDELERAMLAWARRSAAQSSR